MTDETQDTVNGEVSPRRHILKLAGVTAVGTVAAVVAGDTAGAAEGLHLDAETPPADSVQIQRDDTLGWANRSLQAGEIGVDTTTGQIKVGDGSSGWDQLRFVEDTALTAFMADAVSIGDYQSYVSTQVLTADAAWNHVANVVATGEANDVELTLPHHDIPQVASNVHLAPRIEVCQLYSGRIEIAPGANAHFLSNVLSEEVEVANDEQRTPLTRLRTKRLGSVAVARVIMDWGGTTIWLVTGDLEVF